MEAVFYVLCRRLVIKSRFCCHADDMLLLARSEYLRCT